MDGWMQNGFCRIGKGYTLLLRFVPCLLSLVRYQLSMERSVQLTHHRGRDGHNSFGEAKFHARPKRCFFNAYSFIATHLAGASHPRAEAETASALWHRIRR